MNIKCAVCETENKNDTKICVNCGFQELHVIHGTNEDADDFLKRVHAYRIKWEAKKKNGTEPSIGEIINFGSYTWRIIDVQEGRMLILSEKIIGQQVYISQQEYEKMMKDASDKSNQEYTKAIEEANQEYTKATQQLNKTHEEALKIHSKKQQEALQKITTSQQGVLSWANCALRRFLNGLFLKSFKPQEITRIIETTLPGDINPWFGTSNGEETKDKIFLLSINEIIEYFAGVGQWIWTDGNASLKCKDNPLIAKDTNNNNSFWWLRSSGEHHKYVSFVDNTGNVNGVGEDIHTANGIRPAMWLKL